MKRIALVTGATSGVGREFCRQIDGCCFGQLDEIWAVGRNTQELEKLGRNLYAPVRSFALDLRDARSFAELQGALAAEDDPDGPCISWLVNSAGFGWFGREQLADAALIVDMVQVNCLAVVELVRLALPYMQAGSCIVNMSSIAAFLPVPGMGTYASTKRFVLDLTRTLNTELDGTGIHACAVCPKAMDTGFWDSAGEAAGMGKALGSESVYEVVRKAIEAVRSGKGSIITAPDMRALAVATKVLPYGLMARLGSLAMNTAIYKGERRQKRLDNTSYEV